MSRQDKQDKIRDKQITREIHRLFWRANLQRPWHLLACYVCRIPAYAMIHIFMPLTIAYALQEIINQNFGAVPHYAWQLVYLSLGFGVLWTLAGLIIPMNGVLGGVYLQRLVFSNFLHKDYEFYTNSYFGSLGAQAMQLREAYNNQYNIIVFNDLPRVLVIVLGGIWVIASHSISLALITVLAMSAVLSFTFFSGRWRLKWRRIVSRENSNVAGKVGDALTHAAAVKSYAAETHEEDRIVGNLSKWKNAQYVSWALAVPADVGRYFLVACATALLLVNTSNLYQQGTITIAIVAVVQLYVIKMISATVDIGEIIKSYEQAMGGAYQTVKTMLIEPTVLDPETPVKLALDGKATLTLRDVSYSYDEKLTSHKAIDGLSLSIKPGEKIGLVGYSGSGKTTLTKLILRFMDVSQGSIAIDGTDIRNVTQHDLRSHIAYVPQEPLLFHRSIKENIAYGRPSATEVEIVEAAKLAYVDEFVADLPDGYDTLVGDKGVKLSGGQRQRVAIARALLKGAPILVLDEATSALDSESEHHIQKALWRLFKDRTAVVVAHRLSTIQHMDRIVVMDKGKVVATGTHDELLEQKGIYAELWAHQSGGYIGVPNEEQS